MITDAVLSRAAPARLGPVRLGASAGIVGAVLAMIGNGLHPHITDPSLEAFLSLVASRADWLVLHLTIIVSIFCILGALYGLKWSMQEEQAAGMAGLGFAVAVAGATVVAVNFASDGFAMKHVANLWAASGAAERTALLPAARVLYESNLGFYTVWIFLFLGFPFVLYGLALLQSAVYPRWAGWAGLAAGAGCTAVGMLQFAGGETELLTTLFVVFSIAITVWVFVLGILMWRRGDDPTSGTAAR